MRPYVCRYRTLGAWSLCTCSRGIRPPHSRLPSHIPLSQHIVRDPRKAKVGRTCESCRRQIARVFQHASTPSARNPPPGASRSTQDGPGFPSSLGRALSGMRRFLVHHLPSDAGCRPGPSRCHGAASWGSASASDPTLTVRAYICRPRSRDRAGYGRSAAERDATHSTPYYVHRTHIALQQVIHRLGDRWIPTDLGSYQGWSLAVASLV